jgi:RNA polymerase sigma-70 factor (ECF subfamily)
MSTQPALTSASDEDLADWIARRDESATARTLAERAFLELYDRYQARLLHFVAARAPKAELEDALQETWQRVWKHLPSGFHGGRFRAWLFTIADNWTRDVARRRRPVPLTGQDVPAPDEDPEEWIVDTQRRERLRGCLEQLGEDEMAVVRARLSGSSYGDLAAALRLTVERAYRLFHQAKQKLKNCVERLTS